MTIRPVQTIGEEKKDSCVENQDVQKSHKEEEQDFSRDGKNRYYDTDHGTNTMEEQHHANVQKKFSEKSMNLIISLKKRHKIIVFVWNTVSNSYSYIVTNVFRLEKVITNYFEMENKIVNFEIDICNTKFIQEQKNADSSNKELTTYKKNKGLNHIKKIFGNITQISELLEKLMHFIKYSTKICSSEKSKIPETNEEQSRLVHESPVGEENLSDSENEDASSHSESEVGNAQLAHQSATSPNPSVVKESDAESDKMIQEVGSSDPAAGIAVVPQQSINFSAGNTIEKQNDENTVVTELQSISHEEDRQKHSDQESEQSNTDMFKDTNFQTKIADTRVTGADVIHNVRLDEKSIPKEIGKKSIKQIYDLKNDTIILDHIENITKQSFVECDSKETMVRVKELTEKMINRQIDNMEELEFRLCHLEKEHLEEFLLDEVLKAVACKVYKILKLSIGFTENVTGLIPSYCRIASNYKSTNLSLVFDDLKNEDIKALVENLDENDKYTELDISYNRKIEPDGYENVGKIVKEHEVRTLRLADCDISDDDLLNLFDGMGEAKLEEFDISCTNSVTAKGFEHIGKQVAKKRIKRLKLSGIQLDVETLTAFYKEVTGSFKDSDSEVLLEEIDVSYNSAMEPEAYKVLGSMVKLFGVKKLSLAGCGLKKEHLKDFRTKMNSIEETGQYTYTKMKSLNAGDNTSIGKGIVEIAKIVKECLLEELDIRECRFSVNELENFIKALGKAKLKCLYLGEKRQFDKNYVSQVCNLLPCIKETLRLKGTVRNHPRSMLQDKLDKLGESKLEIQLDDDVTLRAQNKDDITNSSKSSRRFQV